MGAVEPDPPVIHLEETGRPRAKKTACGLFLWNGDRKQSPIVAAGPPLVNCPACLAGDQRIDNMDTRNTVKLAIPMKVTMSHAAGGPTTSVVDLVSVGLADYDPTSQNPLDHVKIGSMRLVLTDQMAEYAPAEGDEVTVEITLSKPFESPTPDEVVEQIESPVDRSDGQDG